MNLAEMGTVVTVITTAIAGPVAVRSKGGPWWMVLCSLLVSIPLGIGAGALCGKTAFKCLITKAQGITGGCLFALYCIMPMIFIIGGMTTAFLVFGWLAGHMVGK